MSKTSREKEQAVGQEKCGSETVDMLCTLVRQDHLIYNNHAVEKAWLSDLLALQVFEENYRKRDKKENETVT